jgi:uncharacterized membrane protein AbrB (regulator of aidB expression)
MNSDLTSQLMVIGYLILGTVGIALLAGWLLKRFGPRR